MSAAPRSRSTSAIRPCRVNSPSTRWAIATLPAAVKAGVPIEYAGALMAAIAVIGLDLSRERLVNWVDRLFIKWVGK